MTQQITKSIATVSMSIDGKILGEWNDEQVRTFLTEDAIKEVWVTLVPVILGGVGKGSLSGLPGEFLPKDLQFRLKGIEKVDGVIQMHYVRAKKLSESSHA